MRFNSFLLYRDIILTPRFLSCLWRTRKNIITDRKGLPPQWGPFMAELDVTYRCDCRCRMCRRWTDGRRGEMTLPEYERLAAVFDRMGVQLVSIAGGEPLTRKDIHELIGCFAKYGMSVNLCTNGLSLEKHAQALSRSGASCVTVSVDGAEATTHDMIRGVQGSHEKTENGIRALAAFPRSSRPLIRVRMTVSDHNAREVKSYYEKWRRRVDDVLLQPTHYCTGAFYTGEDEKTFGFDTEELARQISGTPFERDRYLTTLIQSLKENGGYPKQRCYAGTLMVRIDPWGNVYPCLEQRVRVGSVREESFPTVWQSDYFNRVRKDIATADDCRCWYNNTAMISHYAGHLRRTTVLPFRPVSALPIDSGMDVRRIPGR